MTVALTSAAAVGVVANPLGASASSGSFYTYSGSTPLSSIAPGTVLKTRTLTYHVVGIPIPLGATQLLYRSTGSLGQPTTNVTTVIQPPFRFGAPKIVSYQSFYDSLNPADEPSVAIAGNVSLGGIIPNIETLLIAPVLLSGYSVEIPDTEGQPADFAAGPEYGMNTLDGLRAAFASPSLGFRPDTKVGMIGYSGGAIATEWASELAPKYAPDVNRHLVGAAMGGVLVDPAHNLHYIDGSSIWAGVMPMAIIGVSRSFNVDLTPYLSDYGVQVYKKLLNASIINALGQYSGLTWTQLAKPQYPTPESVPVYVHLVNQLIMGTGGTPTTPLFIGQGANGTLEGTPVSPTFGPGDGVMVTGDVRALANQYCARGVRVQYDQYDSTSHVTSVPTWLPAALGWLKDRFGTTQAPTNCGQYAAGNSLAPIPE
ncbi:lipase family protein [Jatrophihabitans sp. GAS493]|uniref:lipase family protein n=1 Tax=Jatrophihabitans sp. GAS493 TaxID=1907575 RepID=UPI0018D519B5|nr:lipase family protein [Jatrophihabitans sp. GAS493]